MAFSAQAQTMGVSALTCASSSVTGTASDACTITLTTAAPANGQVVNLGSNDAYVTIPSSVTVAAGTSSAAFTASVAGIYSSQTATLTARTNGIGQTFAISLVPPAPASLTCASASVTGAAADPCTVTLTAGAPSRGMTVNLSTYSSGHITVPSTVTLSPGQVSATFTASIVSVYTAQADTVTARASNVPQTFTINLIPPAPNAITCANGSMTGAGTDLCTVTLAAGVPSSGLRVNLSSTSGAVIVPSGVPVASGASSFSFTATVSAVTSSQSATLTATADGGSASVTLQLVAQVPTLSVSSSSVAFGNVDLNSPATQEISLISSGTEPVTISASSLTGTGYSMSGVSFPLTLQPNQTAMLSVTFDPTTAGSAGGVITLASNSSTGSISIGLSGTGVQPGSTVNLNWNAPTNSIDPVASYRVYRSVGGGSFQVLSDSVTATSYSDTTVSNGTSYSYYVTSVDAQGNESAPSNAYATSIP